MIFVDTNVIIDILTRDANWFGWSMQKLSLAAAGGTVTTSAVVVAELARDYQICAPLLSRLDKMSVETLPLGPEPAFLAGKAFGLYRTRRGGDERRVLPDFFIGAHALSLGMPLLTRDAKLYRTYFPDLPLVTPETHP